MPSIRSLLVTCLFLSHISSYVITEPTSEKDADKEALSDLEAFQKLLDQVDPPALHAALHDFNPKKYKHGVFKEDRTAVEAVHRDDAPLATSILALAKRADPGNSTVPVATVTVIDSTVTASINPSTVAPNPVQPSDRSTVQATPQPQSPTTEVNTPSTPNTPNAPPIASTATVLVTSTAPGAPGAPATASATPSLPFAPGPISISKPSTSLAPGMVITTTNAAGVTIVTTIDGGVITLSGPTGAGGATPPGASASASASALPLTSFTSVVLQTTTLADGAQSTITAVTVIQASAPAVVTPSGSAGAGPTTTGPAAGLQTGLAPRSRTWGWEVVGVLGGAVGFAMVL